MRVRSLSRAAAMLVVLLLATPACGPVSVVQTPLGPIGVPTFRTSEDMAKLPPGPPIAPPVPAASPFPDMASARSEPVSEEPFTFQPAARLIERITEDPELAEAIAATQQALAKGGVATADPHGVFVPAVAPAASVVVVPEETLLLARDARQHRRGGRLSMAQLGQMLRDLGWPFPAGATPGQQLLHFTRDQVLEARQAPEDAARFAWLFLAEAAKRKFPAVDLVSDETRPEQVRLTLLELQLFTAALERTVPQTSTTVGYAEPRWQLAALGPSDMGVMADAPERVQLAPVPLLESPDPYGRRSRYGVKVADHGYIPEPGTKLQPSRIRPYDTPPALPGWWNPGGGRGARADICTAFIEKWAGKEFWGEGVKTGASNLTARLRRSGRAA